MCRRWEVESKFVAKSVKNDVEWCFESFYCVVGMFLRGVAKNAEFSVSCREVSSFKVV